MHTNKNQRKRKVPKSCPFQLGSRVRICSLFDHHDYQQGRTYFVADIDDDDCTLRAQDELGKVGCWIRWVDCVIINGIGWDWLKDQLSPEARDLLSAFDGLDLLQLRDHVSVALVAEIPSLKEGILSITSKTKTSTSQP